MKYTHIKKLLSHKESLTFEFLYTQLGYVYIGNVYENPHYFAEFGIQIRNEDLAYFAFTSLAVNLLDEGFLYSDFGNGRHRFMCEFTQAGIDKLIGAVKHVG